MPLRLFLVAVLVLAAAACGSEDEKDSAFCKDLRESVAPLEQSYASLAEASQGVGQTTDLQEAQAAYTAALNGVIEALASPPAEIQEQAASTVEGLRQQLAAAGEVQLGSPPAPFPADRQAAAGQIDGYLQTTCASNGTLTPR